MGGLVGDGARLHALGFHLVLALVSTDSEKALAALELMPLCCRMTFGRVNKWWAELVRTSPTVWRELRFEEAALPERFDLEELPGRFGGLYEGEETTLGRAERLVTTTGGARAASLLSTHRLTPPQLAWPCSPGTARFRTRRRSPIRTRRRRRGWRSVGRRAPLPF